MYDDVIKIKQMNDMKIQQGIQQLEMVQKCLKESNEYTAKMTNLLNSFDSRLSVLNELIMPVYNSTNDLQTKFTNLNKTINSLDSIIGHYEATKTLSQIIKAGPGKDINTYISHLDKLKNAMNYFEANNRFSEKAQNEELWHIGKQNVEREYELLLGKHTGDTFLMASYANTDNMSDTQSINDDASIDIVDDASGTYVNETDIKQVRSIIVWFATVEPTYIKNLFEKLSKFRCDPILEALRKSIEMGSLANKRQSLSYQGMNSPVPNRNGKIDHFKTKISKTFRGNTPFAESQRSFMNEQDFESSECENYLKSFRSCLKCFQIENKFVNRLLNNQKNQVNFVLDRIYRPVLRFLKIEAERINQNVKQVTNKRTSKFVIALFDLLNDMVNLKTIFLRLFEDTENLDSIQNLLEIFSIIEKACAETLRDIVDEIKNDSKPVSQNGNIHPITTETITFIENLLSYDKIIGTIANIVVNQTEQISTPSEIELQQRKQSGVTKFDSRKTAYQFNSVVEQRTATIALVEYICKLFSWLNLSLKNKAESYMDLNLKWIFLLNNYFKILKLFESGDMRSMFSINPSLNNDTLQQQNNENTKKKTLIQLFSLIGRGNYVETYENEIRNCKREYSKCWSKLVYYMEDLSREGITSDTKLKDKDRQLLKDKFHGFNKEFEDIMETQVKYVIPSSELADQLKEENNSYIVTKYKKFYDTYSRLNFATNRDKYIKYTPEDLSLKLREFFTAY